MCLAFGVHWFRHRHYEFFLVSHSASIEFVVDFEDFPDADFLLQFLVLRCILPAPSIVRIHSPSYAN